MKKEKIHQKAYITEMRLRFSNNDMIHSTSGQINHGYFLTKIGRYWSSEKVEHLFSGIEQFGIGNWGQMNQNIKALTTFTLTDLELKAKVLLNTIDISAFEGMKLKKKDIFEFARLSKISVENIQSD